MTRSPKTLSYKAANAIVSAALLVILFPHNGVPPQTPAGVRTAVELLDKKIVSQVLVVNGLKSVSRS